MNKRAAMGICGSAVQKEPAKIDAAGHIVKKVLMSGTGGCGKSTIFKQITVTQEGGFSDEAKSEWAMKIFHKMAQICIVIGQACKESVDNADLTTICEIVGQPGRIRLHAGHTSRLFVLFSNRQR